jgi:hypothetical protein
MIRSRSFWAGGGEDRKKQEFAKTARLLNERKLDLAEAEKQYQREN